MTPSIIVFDLGKVLVDFDYSIAGRRIAAHANVPAAQVQAVLDHAPLLVRFETGRITRQEFYAEVRRQTGFRGSLTEFAEFFSDIFTEMPAMTALHAELRRRRFPTFIFSNTNDLAVEHIRRRFPFFAGFDGYILSYEVGSMKPHAAIYEALESLSGRRGADIIYLDDRPENVAAAADRGWNAVLHETPEESRAALERIGVIGRSAHS
jgi:putative hydrolase of the HAD superfamily